MDFKKKQRFFSSTSPPCYPWLSLAFLLSPLDAGTTEQVLAEVDIAIRKYH